MDTKETTLDAEKLKYPANWGTKSADMRALVPNDVALKAMDIHARNCMIEFLIWYFPDSQEREEWAGIIDRFLQSEYFKELQK